MTNPKSGQVTPITSGTGPDPLVQVISGGDGPKPLVQVFCGGDGPRPLVQIFCDRAGQRSLQLSPPWITLWNEIKKSVGSDRTLDAGQTHLKLNKKPEELFAHCIIPSRLEPLLFDAA